MAGVNLGGQQGQEVKLEMQARSWSHRAVKVIRLSLDFIVSYGKESKPRKDMI